MNSLVARYGTVPGLVLALAACGGNLRPVSERGLLPHADGDNMRRVMGETVTDVPLIPEPGDIWSDLSFLKRPTDRPAPESHAVEPPPPRRAERAQPSPPATGSFFVQLGAATSEDAARAEWQTLRTRMPDLIGERTPTVVASDVDGRRQWHLRTGGFATRADANAFCSAMQKHNASCRVVAGAA